MADYEMEKIENIATHPLFEGMFRIDKKLLRKIEQNMRDENYDESQPIIVGTWEGQDEPVCIDGHTRLKAATNAGIKEIAVYSYEFETEEDAFEYAIRLQSNRRNFTDGDLLHCIERLHQQMPRGGDRKSEAAKSTPKSCGKQNGRSAGAKRTGDLLNISSRKVEQALTVINKGLPEVKEAVLKNKMSINRAYKKTQDERKRAEEQSPTVNSGEQSDDESHETEEMDESQTSKFHATVFISMEHFGALHELDGSVEDHVTRAIEMYLESLKEGDEQNLGEKDQEDEGEQDHEECGTDDATADEDGQGESDDNEYFDPDSYENQDYAADDQSQGEEEGPESDGDDEDEDDDDDDEIFDPDSYEDD